MKCLVLLLLWMVFYSCSENPTKIHCKLVDMDVKSCLCSNSKKVNLIFKSNRLETCFIDGGNLIYSINLYPGTDKIRYVIVGNKQDDSYYTINFENNNSYIDKHNVSLNEIISLKKNNLGGYDYNVYYTLNSPKSKISVFNLSTDSLNQLLPDYCYYEYDKKKSSYTYISEVLTENGIKDDSLVFKYFEVDNLNDLNYYEYSNGTVGIKSKKKSNLLVTKELTFNQGSSKALVGELHVYFKRNQQLDSINLLLVFQGDLQERLFDFNKGASKFNQQYRSDKITEKKKICKELLKFGVTFKDGKAYLSESLKSAMENAETK